MSSSPAPNTCNPLVHGVGSTAVGRHKGTATVQQVLGEQQLVQCCGFDSPAGPAGRQHCCRPGSNAARPVLPEFPPTAVSHVCHNIRNAGTAAASELVDNNTLFWAYAASNVSAN